MEQKLAQLQAKIEADQSIGEKLFGLETPEEVQGFLKEQGIEFTLDEINVLRNVLAKQVAQGGSGELSDEALEEVAGGIVITAGVVGATASVLGASCGAGTFVHTITSGRW